MGGLRPHVTLTLRKNIMAKMFALVSGMGEVYTVDPSREALETFVAEELEFPLFGMEKIVEFDYNDAPITSRGEEYKEKIRKIFEDSNTTQFRLSKTIGFYELSIDDRFEFIHKLLTEVREAPQYKFNDSRE